MSAHWTPPRGPMGYPLFAYHIGRTVQWGNWGITFSEKQPDERKNFGVIVGQLPFAVGACGPIDGTIGSEARSRLQAACDAWVRDGTEPAGMVAFVHEHACNTNYVARAACTCSHNAEGIA